jgi:alkylated DNA repair dioxygenase AlkB
MITPIWITKKVSPPEKGESKTVNLPDKGVFKMYTDFIDTDTQKALYEELATLDVWEQGEYMMHGSLVKTPRVLTSMWDSDDVRDRIDPGGSVIWTKENEWIKKGIKWTPNVLALKEKIEEEIGVRIDYAQLNWYRDGNDYIGWHSDDEVPDGSFIISLSVGSARDFVLRHKTTFPNLRIYKDTAPEKRIYTKYQVSLEPGMLFIMDQDTGKNAWKHMLPKRPGAGDRINITFRQSFIPFEKTKVEENSKFSSDGYLLDEDGYVVVELV